MAKKKITDLAAELLEDFLAEGGYELYHAEFVKEGKDWFLRVYIDRPDGEPIGTEDCEKVSRFLSDRLDEDDPVEQNYYLEVSSPGMDRQLYKPEHYRRALGKEIEVKLYKGKDGRKTIEGVLQDFSGEMVTVTDHDGKEWQLCMDEIAKTKMAVIF